MDALGNLSSASSPRHTNYPPFPSPDILFDLLQKKRKKEGRNRFRGYPLQLGRQNSVSKNLLPLPSSTQNTVHFYPSDIFGAAENMRGGEG